MIRSSTPHSAASQPPSNSLAAHGTPWVEGRDVKCATLYQARHTQPPLARSLTASHGSPLRRQRTQRSHGSPLRKREGIQGAPYATTVRSLARLLAKSCLTARHWGEGGYPQVCHTQPPFVRPLVRQLTSHGPPLVTWRAHKRAPHPTTVRSPTRSPIHVSRLATGHIEGTQGAPYATTGRSLTRSPRQVSRVATEKEGGNTRGAIRNHRSLARSLARQVMSHGSPPATWRGRRRATLIYRSFARSLANLCLTARHWSHGGDTRGVTLHHRSLARSPIHVSLIAIGKGVTPKRDLWA